MCTICKKILIADEHNKEDPCFFEHDGHPYCTEHHYEMFGERCGGCEEVIKADKIFHALGQAWHEEHFCCVVCQNTFDEDLLFYENEGLPYCESDFVQQICPPCAGCHEKVDLNYCEMNGKPWHVKCLTCCVCATFLEPVFTFDDESAEQRGKSQQSPTSPSLNAKSMNNQAYTGDDGNIYCREHFLLAESALCAECGKPLGSEPPLQALGREWHAACFTCCVCNNQIGKEFVEHPNTRQRYCKEHWYSLAAATCECCHLPISTQQFPLASEVRGKKYHQSCLKCCQCSVSLIGNKIFEKEGKLFCEDHCATPVREKCPTCNKVLQGIVSVVWMLVMLLVTLAYYLVPLR